MTKKAERRNLGKKIRRITKKAERRNLGKEIRRKTGLPLPVAQRLAKGIVKSGAVGFALDNHTGETARRAAQAVTWETIPCDCGLSGCASPDKLRVVGPKGTYYL